MFLGKLSRKDLEPENLFHLIGSSICKYCYPVSHKEKGGIECVIGSVDEGMLSLLLNSEKRMKAFYRHEYRDKPDEYRALPYSHELEIGIRDHFMGLKKFRPSHPGMVAIPHLLKILGSYWAENVVLTKRLHRRMPSMFDRKIPSETHIINFEIEDLASLVAAEYRILHGRLIGAGDDYVLIGSSQGPACFFPLDGGLISVSLNSRREPLVSCHTRNRQAAFRYMEDIGRSIMIYSQPPVLKDSDESDESARRRIVRRSVKVEAVSGNGSRESFGFAHDVMVNLSMKYYTHVCYLLRFKAILENRGLL